jgi:hypothetical protein
MCGIFGFINADNTSKFGDTVLTVFEQGLRTSMERGINGTGVLSINGYPGHYQTTMYKNAMWSPDFVFYHTYRDMVRRRLSFAKAAIGHTRATTRGSVRHENAHPFEYKHITLVQNGFIAHADKWLPKGVNHEVDSFTAAYLMAEKGEKEALECMEFGGVFVWWNSQDNTLNMARNNHRELWCVAVEGQNTMFYASEWEQLYWLLSRNGLKPSGKFLELPENIHIKFDISKPKEWQKLPFVQLRDRKSQQASSRGTPAMGASGNTSSTGSTTQKQSADYNYETDSYNVSGDDDKVRPKRPDQITEAECEFVERMFERLSSKDKKKYGIPESRVKLRKILAKIENTGIPNARFGARFIVYGSSWGPYKNQRKFGVIEGSKRANAEISIEIPNTTKEDWDNLQANQYAFATIVNAKKDSKGKWKLVMALIPDEDVKPVGSTSIMSHTKADGTQAQLIRGPRGSYIELNKFQAMCSGGCAYCTGIINPNFVDLMEWFNEEPICHECAQNEKIREELGFNVTKKAVH